MTQTSSSLHSLSGSNCFSTIVLVMQTSCTAGKFNTDSSLSVNRNTTKGDEPCRDCRFAKPLLRYAGQLLAPAEGFVSFATFDLAWDNTYYALLTTQSMVA